MNKNEVKDIIFWVWIIVIVYISVFWKIKDEL